MSDPLEKIYETWRGPFIGFDAFEWINDLRSDESDTRERSALALLDWLVEAIELGDDAKIRKLADCLQWIVDRHFNGPKLCALQYAGVTENPTIPGCRDYLSQHGWQVSERQLQRWIASGDLPMELKHGRPKKVT